MNVDSKNKGFTLIEILVTILLIVVMFLVVVPFLNKISIQVKNRELDAKKEVLISAAELYANNNLSEFGDASYLKIKVRTLLYYGYVNSDKECSEKIGCIINPTDGSSMNDEIITIRMIKSVSEAIWGDYNPKNIVYISFISNGLNKELFKSNAVDDENYYVGNYADGNKYLMFYIDLSQCRNEMCEFDTSIINTTREGFEIKGWALNNNSIEEEYKLGKKILISSKTNNQKYYAVSKKDVTVTFDPNGGTISKYSDSCTIWNSNVSCLISEPLVSKEGYTFVNWTDKDGNVVDFSKIGDTSTIDVDKDFELKANWKIKTYTYRWYGYLTHVEYVTCKQKCRLECTNMPSQFIRNGVTYNLECKSNGEYSNEDSSYMRNLMHYMRGKTGEYGCTTISCEDNGTTYGTCTYPNIQFSQVQTVNSQESCKLIENK